MLMRGNHMNNGKLRKELQKCPLWRPFGFPTWHTKMVLCCHSETLRVISEQDNIGIPWHNCAYIALFDSNIADIKFDYDSPMSEIPIVNLENLLTKLVGYDLVVLSHNWDHYLGACYLMVKKGIRFHYVIAPISYNLGFTTTHLQDYLEKNYHKLMLVHEMLEDEESRQILISRIKAIVTGNVGYLYLSSFDEYFHPICSPREGDIVIDGGISDYVQPEIDISKTIGNSGLVLGFEPDLYG